MTIVYIVGIFIAAIVFVATDDISSVRSLGDMIFSGFMGCFIGLFWPVLAVVLAIGFVGGLIRTRVLGGAA